MQNNNKWFSIILAMWVVLIITLTAFMILEYMIPFSNNIKWIENSSKSYYEANSWIEEAMWFINQNIVGSESWTVLPSTPIWNKFDVIANWSILPVPLSWNSEYDSNWNRIFQWWPIQLEVWWDVASLDGGDWSNVKFFFRVPDLNWHDDLATQTLSWWILPIINWQLSSGSNSLNSSWSYIEADKICIWWNSLCNSIKINNYDWIDLDGDSFKFSNYFEDNCTYWDWIWTWSWCVLKLSVINLLRLNDNDWTIYDWTIVPYLEWKIDSTNTGKNIPLRYSIIKTSGKSYWFMKNLEVRVPQQTISEAFDFTVFQ